MCVDPNNSKLNSFFYQQRPRIATADIIMFLLPNIKGVKKQTNTNKQTKNKNLYTPLPPELNFSGINLIVEESNATFVTSCFKSPLSNFDTNSCME